mmetsp:Transcript_17835/g.40521  ORF Transcript_17835/g.40521 Transcript_17835/m.40521 type:complete len:232 (+) Transcript_17835:83-778(+)
MRILLRKYSIFMICIHFYFHCKNCIHNYKIKGISSTSSAKGRSSLRWEPTSSVLHNLLERITNKILCVNQVIIVAIKGVTVKNWLISPLHRFHLVEKRRHAYHRFFRQPAVAPRTQPKALVGLRTILLVEEKRQLREQKGRILWQRVCDPHHKGGLSEPRPTFLSTCGPSGPAKASLSAENTGTPLPSTPPTSMSLASAAEGTSRVADEGRLGRGNPRRRRRHAHPPAAQD